MPDDNHLDPKTGYYICDIEEKLTYIDANTGEWLNFAGNGAPKTDEEAEHVLPWPPKYTTKALDTYYEFRRQKMSIMEALFATMKVMDEANYEGF